MSRGLSRPGGTNRDAGTRIVFAPLTASYLSISDSPSGRTLDNGVCGAIRQPACWTETRRLVGVITENAVDLRVENRGARGLLCVTKRNCRQQNDQRRGASTWGSNMHAASLTRSGGTIDLE